MPCGYPDIQCMMWSSSAVKIHLGTKLRGKGERAGGRKEFSAKSGQHYGPHNQVAAAQAPSPKEIVNNYNLLLPRTSASLKTPFTRGLCIAGLKT